MKLCGYVMWSFTPDRASLTSVVCPERPILGPEVFGLTVFNRSMVAFVVAVS